MAVVTRTNTADVGESNSDDDLGAKNQLKRRRYVGESNADVDVGRSSWDAGVGESSSDASLKSKKQVQTLV